MTCFYCKGVGKVGPPSMAYDCPDCGGKGWLTDQERRAIEQRYGARNESQPRRP